MKPLYVDLDGTLLKTDSLHESLFLLLKKYPWKLFNSFFWLLKGKAFFKTKVAEITDLNVELLPYHDEFLKWIKEEKSKGRKVILATGANEKIAKAVSEYLNLDEVPLSSNEEINRTGSKKLEDIADESFAYAGNEIKDLAIWEKADEVILVSNLGFKNKIEKKIKIDKYFPDSRSKLNALLKALRPHQWSKNILIFLPLFLAHEYSNTSKFLDAIFSFFSFSMVASSVYIFNDLSDLESDRRHKTKCKRSFASGDVSLLVGAFLGFALLAIGLVSGWLLSSQFFIVLAAYFLLTSLYSFRLKSVLIIDVIILSCLYTIRIFAGAVATNTPVSHWLLTFSVFFFLSLAFIKRYVEIYDSKEEDKGEIAGRDYHLHDIQQVLALGTASGYISVLVLVFYLNSDRIFQVYHNPKALWTLVPLLLYWMSRLWLLAGRGQIHEDPVVFTLKDKVSFVLGVLASLILIFAAKF